MAHRLFIALVAGAFACGIGAAHAQQKPGPETHSGQPSSTLSAPTDAPDAQGHDSQTGNPESAHRHAPQPGTDGKASDDKTSGKSADETSGKMDAGTPTPPAK